MSDNKHIDRLFQEKFKDFEVKPNPNVWENIQKGLDKPEEEPKKTLPLWLKFASIAAALLLFTTLGYTLLGKESNNKSEPSVVNTDTQKTNIPNNNNNNTTSEEITSNTSDSLLKPNTTIVHQTDTEAETENNTTIISKAKLQSKGIYHSKTLNKTTDNKKHSLVNLNNKTKSARNNKTINNTDLVNKGTATKQTRKSNSYQNTTTTYSTSKNNSRTTNAIALSKTKNILTPNNSTYNNNNNNTILNSLDNIAVTNPATLVNTLNKKGNSLIALDITTSNAIDAAIAKQKKLKEKDEKENEDENINKWAINGNIAPVYYNTLGKGSHLDEQFIENPKNGEVNTSYGVKVSYALNDKIKIRSGINKLNLSYDTANVIVYETVTNSPVSNSLKNIDFIPNNQNQTTSILSTNNLIVQQAYTGSPSTGGLAVQQIDAIINDRLNAALSQRISYIEFPLEIEYALIKKPSGFGLNVIGGLSTFILNNNQVVTEVENTQTIIGEANNINNISFSTNFGLGIDYNFSSALKFNLEPTFKYQMNAFNNTSGDFKPYIIGVYTGFTYRF